MHKTSVFQLFAAGNSRASNSRAGNSRAGNSRATRAALGLGVLLTLVTLPARLWAQGILAPPPAAAQPPPVIAPENDGALNRKLLRKQSQPAEALTESGLKEAAKEVKKIEDAKAEAQKPRPLYGFTEFSLLQPKVSVNSGRKNYVSDLTVHINTYVRALWSEGPETTQPWIGLRVAPFSGVGTQGLRTSRYAFTYIGPAVGIGSIATSADPAADNPVRYGYLLSAGISGMSRLVGSDESTPPLPSDFSPIAWGFDPPGVWSEIRLLRISRGALGCGLMAGVQTGQGKIFYYAGIFGSGFY
jgi:hypothetical protein